MAKSLKLEKGHVALNMSSTSSNTIIASWSWTKQGKKTNRWQKKIEKGKKKNTAIDCLAGYSYTWNVVYSTVKGTNKNGRVQYKDVKIKESSGTLGKGETATSFTIPEGALKVTFSITPTSKKYKDKNGKEHPYFSGKAKTLTKTIATEAAEKPSAPTVSVENGKLTASLKNLSSVYTVAAFQIVEDNTKVWKTINNVAIRTGYAEINQTLNPGHKYKVRARIWHKNGTGSQWSDYSESVDANPKAVTNAYINTLGSNTVYITWTDCGDDVSYELEWYSKPRVKDPETFDTTSSKSSQTCSTNAWTIEGLASGTTWFFRVRVVKGSAKSAWYPKEEHACRIVLGQTPSPPTTYTMVSSVRVNDPVYFYWVYNAEDGSHQSLAELSLTYSSSILEPVTETITVENMNFYDPENPGYYDPDKWDENLYYVLDTSKPREGVSFTEGLTIEWRVRTRSVAGDWSDWSVKRRVDVWAAPYINILASSTLGGWLWDPFNFSTDDIFSAPKEVLPDVDGDDILRSLPVGVQVESGPATQTPIGYLLEIDAVDPYSYENEFGETVTVNSDQIIFSRYYTTDKHFWAMLLTPFNVDFEDGQKYRIRATVTMNSGLTDTEEYEFTVDWDEVDMYPDADVAIDSDGLYATITPYCRDAATISEMPDDIEEGDEIPEELIVEPELVDNVQLSIYRKMVNGEFVEIATQIPNDGAIAITDPHPTLDSVVYRIVAYKMDTGQMRYADTDPEDVPQSGIVISWDETWYNVTNEMNFGEDNEDEAEMDEIEYSGTQLRLPFNVDISEASSPDVNLVNYIGRKRPVSYYGTQLGESATWKTEIPRAFSSNDTFGELMPNPEETLNILRQLSIYTGDVYVRESAGRTGYWANVKASWDITHATLTIPVSLTVTRVEGGM